MQKKLNKLALVVVGVALLAGVGLSYDIPPYAEGNFKTYITNCYTYLAGAKPYYRNWGTVSGMPTFMMESVRTRNGYTAETVKFDRTIVCPFVCAGGFGSVTPDDSAALMTASIKIFRDYDNGTPLNFNAGFDKVTESHDSMWFDAPIALKSIVITRAAADSPGFFIVGGFGVPVP